MIEYIASYLQVIQEERFWSWTIIGILYLISGLTVRGWFLNPVFNQAREIRKQYYGEVKQVYLKNSLIGWFFFFVPLAFIIVLWNQVKGFPMNTAQHIAILAGALSFVLSIVSHLKAFTGASLTVLRTVVEEKELQTAMYKQS